MFISQEAYRRVFHLLAHGHGLYLNLIHEHVRDPRFKKPTGGPTGGGFEMKDLGNTNKMTGDRDF